MELKVYHCNEWNNEYTEFYKKNEVDALIDRKDKAFEYAQAVILIDIEIIKKQKRKRCLAMADMNWWQANRYSAAEMVERIRWNFEEAMQCSKLKEKSLKRYHKWLKLAEKFK